MNGRIVFVAQTNCASGVRLRKRPFQRDGGVEQLKIALWGDLSKSNRDGGSPNWKIGNDRLLFDWQTAGRNHIHMTVRAKAKA